MLRLGLSAKAMRKDFRGECIYQAEQETHFPELTVRETLAFAAAARVPRNRFPGVTRTRYVEHVSDAAMAMFNLSKAAETKIGDDLIRGVSGGERKRVSIAEGFIGGSPLQCWDNSTRGLDSSTALSFVKFLRTSTRTAATTSIVSAYQVSQPMYDVRSHSKGSVVFRS
jgi:ATP-binding cassette, subfamily G (WHITE), member 2, PDR